MFTGIVQGMAKIVSHSVDTASSRLVIEMPEGTFSNLVTGASVAVDGVCLTAVQVDGAQVHFDLIGETLDKTTLGSRQKGEMVNVERAAKVGDEIGGHEMSGHISTTSRVARIERPDGNHILWIDIDAVWMKYILAKGFIGIDGCSLTVAEVDQQGSFSVWLIPETLDITCFGHREVGDRVNIEIDARTQAIVDTIHQRMEVGA